MNIEGMRADNSGAYDLSSLAGRRILVIDDEPDFAESL